MLSPTGEKKKLDRIFEIFALVTQNAIIAPLLLRYYHFFLLGITTKQKETFNQRSIALTYQWYLYASLITPMDLRPSLPFRSPLARLNSNHQRQRDQNYSNRLFSSGEGRTTRAVSRKLRRLFEDPEDELRSPIKIASSPIFATSSGDRGSDSRTDVGENRIVVASKPKKKAGPKSAAFKKRKSKLKKSTSVGRWEDWERFEFLRGLRRHGRGNWKKIGESIPTRYDPSSSSSSLRLSFVNRRAIPSFRF